MTNWLQGAWDFTELKSMTEEEQIIARGKIVAFIHILSSLSVSDKKNHGKEIIEQLICVCELETKFSVI